MIVNDAAETERWARAFARGLARPTVVLLSGGLGAGKTQITSWCVRELLGDVEVASPTFAIHHRYGDAIDHVDLYRVESDAALEGVGFWELFTQDDGLVFVEWANRLPEDVWPDAWTRVFVHVEVRGKGREITVDARRPD